MLRKTMLALTVLATFGLTFAQVFVSPTIGTGADQIAKGPTQASVTQEIDLILPQATALHLAANRITFDLNYLDGADWAARARGDLALSNPPYACVYVSGPDVVFGAQAALWGQAQTVPGGIGYQPLTWDQIKLVYYGNGKTDQLQVPDTQQVVTYPPIRLTTAGLVAGSKDYFVCYQTFVIQLFSNFNRFDLQVRRTDPVGPLSIQHLYVQGNTCAEFGTGTGLYDLPNGAIRHLLPIGSLSAGPTGTRDTATDSCNPNSSWMDVLGVLAVKINADHHGTNTAALTYTLVSTDTTF